MLVLTFIYIIYSNSKNDAIEKKRSNVVYIHDSNEDNFKINFREESVRVKKDPVDQIKEQIDKMEEYKKLQNDLNNLFQMINKNK